MFRDVDIALDYERISSPNLKALNRTRSSDSLVAASDTSELSSWSESGSFFVVDPLSSPRGSVSEESLEGDYEWAASEEHSRQLEKTMSASAYYTEEPLSDALEAYPQSIAVFSPNGNPFGCQGLHPGIPYLTPPADGYEDDNTEATHREDLRSSGGGCDSLDLDQDSIIDATEVFTNDPCNHQEHKGFKLPFFSRKKSSAPKPIKPSSKLSLGIRMPSVPCVSKLLSKRADAAGEFRNKSIRETKTEKNCRRNLDWRESHEFFFDQQEERKKEFVRLSNASTATLTLESVEDMQTLNDALPVSKL